MNLNNWDDAPNEFDYKAAMLRSQKQYMEALIEITKGNIPLMVAMSGVTRQHIYRMLNAHDLLEKSVDVKKEHRTHRWSLRPSKVI